MLDSERFGALRELLHTRDVLDAARWIEEHTEPESPARVVATRYADELVGAAQMERARLLNAVRFGTLDLRTLPIDPWRDEHTGEIGPDELDALNHLFAGWPHDASRPQAWETLRTLRPDWAERIDVTTRPLWHVRADFGPLQTRLDGEVRATISDEAEAQEIVDDEVNMAAWDRMSAIHEVLCETPARDGETSLWWHDAPSVRGAPADLQLLLCDDSLARLQEHTGRLELHLSAPARADQLTLYSGSVEGRTLVRVLTVPLGDGRFGWAMVAW